MTDGDVAVVAVVDRTSGVLAAVRAAAAQLRDVEVVEVRRSSDFDLGGVDADLLVLGPREFSAAGLRRAGRWSSEHPGAPLLAAVAPGPVDVRALTGVGVVGWCTAGDADALLDLLDETLAELDGVALVEEEVVAVEPEPEPLPPEPGLVVTVLSAAGGSGKTFLATSLAVALADGGRRVLLVDLDLRGGRLAAALQVRHPHSVYDGLYDAKGRRLAPDALVEHLGALVHRATDLGIDVLLSPQDPTLGELVTGDDVAELLDVLVDHYDVVVLDTASSLDDVTLAAAERADVAPVVATLDVPALRGLTDLLRVLDQLGVDEGVRRLVLNKVEPDLGLDVKQAQEAFSGGFVATLPLDRAVSRSLNTGRALLRSEPRSPAAKALVKALGPVLPFASLPAPVRSDPLPVLASGLTRLGRALVPGATS
ncbi:MAG: cobyrinic acid a,c-diamide synthase [Frankiales bacterium]|nr:cobyrinic acid a,c-diamide synthase [Frankiales bacterium]